jgi:hypothetical protein
MTSSFDRLEKLFSSTRRKSKSGPARRASQKELSAAYTQVQPPDVLEGSLFPPPSFIKPTSTRMQPRAPVYEKKCEHETKARSQSVPTVQTSLQRRSSGYRHSDVARKTRSYASTTRSPALVPEEEEPDTPSTRRSSRFRFPEDSLFRYSQVLSPVADELSTADVPKGTSPDTLKAEEPRESLLDWSPQHISFLFHPNEIPSVEENVESHAEKQEPDSSILMPPPLFSSPEKPLPKPPIPIEVPTTPIPGSVSPKTQAWNFPLFPQQYSVLRSPTAPLYSPPPSDSGDEEYIRSIAGQTIAPGTFESPSLYSIQSSPDLFSLARQAHMRTGSTDTRDAWDITLDDQTPMSLFEQHLIPRSRLQNAQSFATLTEITAQMEREHILQEPTIMDIYALSDEDILEARTPTIPPPPTMPPPPPPKDLVRLPKRPSTVSSRSQRVSTMDLTVDEMTPPDTPTDPQFLIPMPASHSAGELGAIMAAGIAKKYNFDLVYLVSVWPSAGGNHLDPSLRKSSDSPRRVPSLGGSIYASTKSTVTGRYLAAFGLSEVAEPFQIPTNSLLQTLGTAGWSEGQKVDGTMTRGWTCAFDCDHAPAQRGNIAESSANNRGIVFAAYTKSENESAFPTEPSAKGQRQEQLYADVQLLVQSLVEKA